MVKYKVSVIPLEHTPTGYVSQPAVNTFELSTTDPGNIQAEAASWINLTNIPLPNQYRLQCDKID